MNENNDKGLHKNVINWYPGHMAKTKREIKEKLSLIDVVYEVLDARMPYSSKIVDLDTLVQNKPRILIMTKYDLCDQKETDRYIDWYKNQGYLVVPVNLLTGENVSMIVEESKKLMTEVNRKRKEKGLKPRNIRALIVGVPNVGKSTLINALVKKRATGVGNKPGVTKQLGWIRIHKDIELLDSPGILWPKLTDQEAAYHLASFSSIKEEIIDLEELSAFILRKMERLYPEQLVERYNLSLPLPADYTSVYEQIAKKRGALSRGGNTDFDKVYTLIVRDLKEGRLGNVTFDRLQEMERASK